MSSYSVFADKNEHLIILQWFSEAGLAEDIPDIFQYKITVKVLWVPETSGPLDQGRAGVTQGMGIA